LFGNPGAGKSHLLCALAQELVVARGRKMKYTTCTLLVQDLLAAKRDLRLKKEIRRLGQYDGLIIDEMGYVQQSREEMEVLFTLLAERYERGSVLLTSNLPFSKWEEIFKDPMTTAAAIDRLVHHCVILELNLPSYRMEQAKKNRDSEVGGELAELGDRSTASVSGKASATPLRGSAPAPPERSTPSRETEKQEEKKQRKVGDV